MPEFRIVYRSRRTCCWEQTTGSAGSNCRWIDRRALCIRRVHDRNRNETNRYSSVATASAPTGNDGSYFKALCDACVVAHAEPDIAGPAQNDKHHGI